MTCLTVLRLFRFEKASENAWQVDFELIGGQILRQRVPQDWVLLAATSREIKATVRMSTVEPSQWHFVAICLTIYIYMIYVCIYCL